MYCSKCGKQIADGSSFCSDCGTRLGSAPQSPSDQASSGIGTRDQQKQSDYVYPRNPPTSPYVAYWNLLWPGIGHMVLGQVSKGIFLLVGSFIIHLIVLGMGVGYLSLVVCGVSTVDAFKVGKALYANRTVGKWEWFPSV